MKLNNLNVFVLGIFAYFEIFNKTQKTPQPISVCKTFQCSLGDSAFLINMSKMAIGVVNIILCLIFYVILYKYVKGSSASRRQFKKVCVL